MNAERFKFTVYQCTVPFILLYIFHHKFNAFTVHYTHSEFFLSIEASKRRNAHGKNDMKIFLRLHSKSCRLCSGFFSFQFIPYNYVVCGTGADMWRRCGSEEVADMLWQRCGGHVVAKIWWTCCGKDMVDMSWQRSGEHVMAKMW